MLRSFLAFVLVVFCSSRIANADFFFEIENPISPFTDAGTTVVKSLYLTANGADTIQNLGTVGFDMTQVVGGTTTFTIPAPALAPAPGLLVSTNANTPVTLNFSAFAFPAAIPSVSNRVRIGDISFLLGAPGTTTNFLFTDPTPGATNIAGIANNSPNAFSFDATVFGAAGRTVSVGVSAVPEPSSMLALAGIGIVGLGIARYRRKAKSAK